MPHNFLNQLITEGYLKTPRLVKAFKKIKREDFLRDEDREEAEVNAPIHIGHNQTISQPATVAFMLELLEPEQNNKILDVGSGSGWTTALLAEVVGVEEKGSFNPLRVYAIERISELKKFGEQNVEKYNFVSKGLVQFFCGDGAKGLKKFAPFDRILVSAAASNIPQALLNQLAVGGRMVIPIGEEVLQEIVLIERVDQNNYREKRFPGFVFVPLIQSL